MWILLKVAQLNNFKNPISMDFNLFILDYKIIDYWYVNVLNI